MVKDNTYKLFQWWWCNVGNRGDINGVIVAFIIIIIIIIIFIFNLFFFLISEILFCNHLI